MPNRPKVFLLLAAIFLGIVMSFPVQLYWLYGHSLGQWQSLIHKVSLLNVCVMLGLILHVPLLLWTSRWLLVTLPALVALVSWNNYVVGSFAYDYSPEETVAASIAFGLLCASLFLFRDARQVIWNPKARWWATPRRVKASVPICIHPFVKRTLRARAFDISVTGLFVPFDDCYDNDGVTPVPERLLSVGDFASVSIKLSQTTTLHCEAEVVRLSESNGSYPSGMGLRLHGLDPRERACLSGFIREQSSQPSQFSNLHN